MRDEEVLVRFRDATVRRSGTGSFSGPSGSKNVPVPFGETANGTVPSSLTRTSGQSGGEAYVLTGTRLAEAAAEAGIVLAVPCGGEGLCGKCRTRVLSGAGDPTPVEHQRLSADELREGWRLACQTVVCGPMEVEIPPASLAAAEHQILAGAARENRPALGGADDAPLRAIYVELPPPARGDDLPDALRLQRALGGEPLASDLETLQQLPAGLRQAGFCGTAVLAGRRLLDFAPQRAEALAVALDLGTTTLVAELLDLNASGQRGLVTRLNPQTQFGDDVLSRIRHVRQHSDGLRQLHESIARAIDDMIGQLCREADIPRDRIYEVIVAGNTTMQQLFCRIDPSALGEVPFVPAIGHSVACKAAELGIQIHPRGRCYVLPVIGGFVGGDTVAGILATDLADAAPQKPTLLVDIGTNGEIVLSAGGRLSAASTAAGPAFEGARISCGMRGCAGAIEKVIVDGGRLHTNVIGNVPPAGLCGSGLIDTAAELLRHGLLTPQGRLLSPDQLPAGTPADLAERLVANSKEVSFVLASADESAGRRPIALGQRDLRELQLAAGAIRAGIVLLLRRAGLEPSDLDRVYLGGGFGNFIRRANAQRIGLLPQRIEHPRIRSMGNTSLSGARLAALSLRARRAAEAIARRTEHVDLSTDPEFQNQFAEAMIFPEE
jgi:uncharacterized 2Fe-2S/4Fe-4S cluster protein (DUF4445 family)